MSQIHEQGKAYQKDPRSVFGDGSFSGGQYPPGLVMMGAPANPANGDVSQLPLSLHATDRKSNGQAESKPQYPETRAEWTTFPVLRERYDDSIVKGERLRIGGWDVMGEWERPVEERTMRELFSHTRVHRPSVLIGGEGLGYATLTALEEGRDRGGVDLHIVELHPTILRQGKERAERFLAKLSPEQRQGITITWHLGDLRDELKKFPDNSIDIARIDPFPLSPDEKDIDAFVHMEELVRIGKPWLVAAPYVGQPNLPLPKQLAHVNGHFINQDLMHVYVAPPADCEYYKDKRMAIMILRTPVKPVAQFGAGN